MQSHRADLDFGNGERVTLRDIGEWSLPQTDLVVLSACETAVSEELGNGEEILGFGYQMQRIGVEAAISSLWQVSDGGTQVLMNTLYASLQDGHSTAAALQQAQMALIAGECYGVENCDLSFPRGIAVIGIEPNQPSSVSTNLSHPYYWAPFILIGNGL
ncbi:MAG: CHAT domain-containing protein [Thainema sp.]